MLFFLLIMAFTVSSEAEIRVNRYMCHMFDLSQYDTLSNPWAKHLQTNKKNNNWNIWTFFCNENISVDSGGKEMQYFVTAFQACQYLSLPAVICIL